MTAIKSLELDFRAELNQKNFGNSQWEDNSYQYMISTVENSKIDTTVKNRLIELLNDTSVSLQEMYFDVVDYLAQLQ